jgi:hypothetical protein
MMRRVWMMAVLMATMAVLAAGQTVNRQSAQIKADEQEIIALSQKFAEEAIINDSPVVKQSSATRPEMITPGKDGEANPLKMDKVKVRIRGNKARVTSRLVFSGHRSSGESYEHTENWTVDLVRQGDRWRVVTAQLGRSKQ